MMRVTYIIPSTSDGWPNKINNICIHINKPNIEIGLNMDKLINFAGNICAILMNFDNDDADVDDDSNYYTRLMDFPCVCNWTRVRSPDSCLLLHYKQLSRSHAFDLHVRRERERLTAVRLQSLRLLSYTGSLNWNVKSIKY